MTWISVTWFSVAWFSVAWISVVWLLASSQWMSVRADDGVSSPDYGRVIQPLLAKYCTACHNNTETEAGLQMHTYSALQRGGESGRVIEPGKPEDSLLWRRVQGLDEPKMPPPEAPQPTAAELQLIQDWIATGAVGDDSLIPLKSRWQLPKSKKSYQGSSPITAATLIGSEPLLMLGRPAAIELQQGQWRSRSDLEIIGKVTQIRPSATGAWIAISSGIPGVGGQVVVLDASTLRSASSIPQVKQRVEGHRDIVYSGVVSPDGKRLATAGYDRIIRIWDIATGTLERSLEGHNGAVYDLDFDDTGTVLASASADETIKLWRADTGERLDTLGQGEAEQYVVRFDAARGLVLAAGADRRVRAWKLLSKDKPSVSPLLRSVFAHEAPVNQMALSEDGRWAATAGEDQKIKVWNADDWSLQGDLEPVEDVVSGLMWHPDGKRLLIATLSGDLATRDASRLLQIQPEKQTFHQDSNPTPASDAATPPIAIAETETKRTWQTAQLLTTNSVVSGVLTSADMSGSDAGDWYAFDAQKGDEWILSIDAARSGSPLDSQMDLYDGNGQPILRTRLQAARESYFTFRGKDSTNIDDFRLHRWEDMELDQFLYAGGEVVKLWLYPRGPDSGFKVYPGFGNRLTYFDTTATTHALNEPAWIVEELGPNEEPKSNGLPIFPVYYSNDDDATRQGGKDSRLHLVAPHSGRYIVRIRDARGQSGDLYAYKLSILKPTPRMQFRLESSEITLRPGVGTEFDIAIDRFDGLNEAVEIEFVDLPQGLLHAGGLTVEQGQLRATGQLRYDKEAYASLPKEIDVALRATATHAGHVITADSATKLKIRLGDQPAMLLKIIPRDAAPDAAPLDTLRIRPGTTISAQLVIERGDLQGDISFGGDDSGRNLPHGCFVDNIGLNGLLIPAGQSSREVFITAAPITSQQERLFHLRAQVDGNPTTLPVRLIVE